MDMSQSERRDYDNCPGNPKTIKSSVYAPVSLNLMGMYLIKEHMNAHYRRLYNVKATVDTSAPHSKSMQHLRGKSVSARRATPSASSRFPLSKSSQPKSMQSLYDDPNKRLMLENKIDRYLTSVHQEKPQIPEQLPLRSIRPASSASQISRRTKVSSISQPARTKVSPDLLQRHQDYFTQPKEPFCPRTLISNSKSRLTESRDYYPPLRKTTNEVTTSQPLEEDQNKLQVENQNFSAIKRPVPALNIKRDSDHVRWLEEQARKMRAEKKLDELEQTLKAEGFEDLLNAPYCCQRGGWMDESTSEAKNSSPTPYQPYYSDRMPLRNEGSRIKSRPWTSRNRRNLSFLDKNNLRNSELGENSWIHKQLKAEEEEQKYLDFVMEVTNDILIRGIFSDRALKMIFQYHMDRRATDLNVIKMKYMLDKLQEELNISHTARFSYNQECSKAFSNDIANTKYEHSEKPLESQFTQRTHAKNSFIDTENFHVVSVPVTTKSTLPSVFNDDERVKFPQDDPLFYKSFDIDKQILHEEPSTSLSKPKTVEVLNVLDDIDTSDDHLEAGWNPLMDIDSKFTDLDLNSIMQPERTNGDIPVRKPNTDIHLNHQLERQMSLSSDIYENNKQNSYNSFTEIEGISDAQGIKSTSVLFSNSKSNGAQEEESKMQTKKPSSGEQQLTRQDSIKTQSSSQNDIKEDIANVSNRTSSFNRHPSKDDYSFNSFVMDESSVHEVKTGEDDIHSEISVESENRDKNLENDDTNLDTEFSLSEDEKL